MVMISEDMWVVVCGMDDTHRDVLKLRCGSFWLGWVARETLDFHPLFLTPSVCCFTD